MAGFGDDPFGDGPFGEAEWSEVVLYKQLPGIYQDQDEAQGYPLQTWMNAIVPLFDRGLEKAETWRDLRDPLRVTTRYDQVVTITLGRIKDPDAPIEQRGADGTITSDRSFSSPTARFDSTDLGKTLTVLTSGLPSNNRTVVISAVTNTTTVRTNPPLLTDPIPFKWFVKGFPLIPPGEMAFEVVSGDVGAIGPAWILNDGASDFTVLSRSRFFPFGSETRLLTEREGSQGTALSDGRFQAEVEFAQTDVGKPFTVSGSSLPANNVKSQIYAVDVADPTKISLTESITLGTGLNRGVIYALQPGVAGVSVEHVVDGASQPLSVRVRESRITVALATDGSSHPTSTAGAVAAAVTASPEASPLVTAVAAGTGLGVAEVAVLTEIPGAALLLDGGPLTWALLPYPELLLATASPPAGIIEQSGTDLVLSGGSAFSAASATLIATDVGNQLVIRGSALGNDGVYPIATVTGPTSGTVTVISPLSAESGLTWEIRTPSRQADATTVTVRAPSQIELLGADFDLDIDTTQSEARQRSWVESSIQWMEVKGVANSYRIIGLLSGYDVETTALYRVSRAVYSAIPSMNRVLDAETGAGRAGTDGQLTQVGSDVHFVSATAALRASDIGRVLDLSNCSTGGNDDLFTITAWVSPTEVVLGSPPTATAPDNGTGGTLTSPTIVWAVARLYTDLPPTRPLYDDVNVELMQQIVGPTHFLMDTYCWDSSQTDQFTIDITNVTPSTTFGIPSYITVEVTGILQGTGNYSTARVMGVASAWQITDSNGTLYYTESLPTLTAAGPPEVCTFLVYGANVPALGTATMKYICDETTSCDYCKAAAIKVAITPTTILNDLNVDLDRALTMLEARLESEPRPAHVRLIISALSPPPIFRSMSPVFGVTGGGTAFEIIGEGFVDGATVTFGGTPATGIVVVDSEHITGLSPAGTGLVDVVVTNPDTQTTGSEGHDAYQYL